MKIAYRHKLRPDETVSSFVARALRLAASPSPPRALAEVLGGPRVRLHPYLTAHLATISRQLGVSDEELLIRHTLYPLFRWFGFDTSCHLREAMLSNHGEQAVVVAGLPQAKLHFYEGLKFCPVCVREDRERLGYGYYKVDHQVPGIEACFAHGCRLKGLESGDYGYDRYIPMVPVDLTPSVATALQVQFARFSHDVLQLAQQSMHPLHYQPSYHSALDLRGLITQKRQLRICLLKKQLLDAFETLSFGSVLGMPESLGTFEFVGPLLRHKTHYRCHPTKHLLFASWLFNGRADYYLGDQLSTGISAPKTSRDSPEQEKHVLSLLQDGLSMNEIERISGRSRSFIRHIAENHGIPHKTNSMAYPEAVRRQVVKLAESGRHRRLIADQLGVGIGYVEQVIGNTPGLADRRRALRKERRVAEAVLELQKARTEHPDWLRKEIKAQCTWAYFAVYNHDKTLLEALLPPKTKPVSPRKDWEREDLRLSQALRSSKLESVHSIGEIDHLVGGRGFLRKHLSELPQTEAILREMGKLEPNIAPKEPPN